MMMMTMTLIAVQRLNQINSILPIIEIQSLTIEEKIKLLEKLDGTFTKDISKLLKIISLYFLLECCLYWHN